METSFGCVIVNVILNKDAFARDFSCTRVQVPCSLSYSSWAVEGVVVTASSEGHPTSRSPSSTSPTLHSSKECAKRWSLCIALLLLIRDMCMKLGAVILTAVILTSDFNKGAEREAAANASMYQRRIPPLEAAFSHSHIPWPICVLRHFGPRQ